jgi:outer membrane usher protein FimD/PapC
MTSQNYVSAVLGSGVDLGKAGTFSVDITHARSKVTDDAVFQSGNAWRFSYTKVFEDAGTQLNFVGYRFADKAFLSISEFLDARFYGGKRFGNSKEQYQVSASRFFPDSALNASISYDHQTYWDRDATERYSLMVSRGFRFMDKELVTSLSLWRNRYWGVSDDGAFLSLSLPFGTSGRLNSSVSWDERRPVYQTGWSDRLGDRGYWQLNTGYGERNRGYVNGYMNYDSDMATLTASASEERAWRTMSVSARGGMTLTAEGGGLHRVHTEQSPRLIVDTGGISGIPVRGYGRPVRSGVFGTAVLTDISPFVPSHAIIDSENLPQEAEVVTSSVKATLTEGAIGFRRLEIRLGSKGMAVIRLPDGSNPLFGATVYDGAGHEAGIVTDDGNVYLSGMKGGDVLTVQQLGGVLCEIALPGEFPENMLENVLFLPCRPS